MYSVTKKELFGSSVREELKLDGSPTLSSPELTQIPLNVSRSMTSASSALSRSKKGPMPLIGYTESSQISGQRLFEEAAEVYRKSRIVFNTSAKDDVNMRLFEVLATGSFLLTEHVPSIADFGLVDGKHFISYIDLDDAIEKITYFLGTPDRREEVAKDGMEAVLAGHTYQHRAKEVLNIIIPKGDCNKLNEMTKEIVNG
mgnify:CR=1 FL=1